MREVLSVQPMAVTQDQRISETFRRERARLWNFIRRRVPDEADAEDILQDVFYELVETTRLVKPVEQAGAWLFRVARNRIIDLFRAKKPQASMSANREDRLLENLLPSPAEGPEAAFARSVLVEALEAALDELPAAQREVFIAHEIDGLSFKEISAGTGTGVNTLLSRKRYAVTHLRRRLRRIHEMMSEKKGW
ncbi:MAG TPA: sigma-70 family RNA polymerase sigma factor [Bryobacteraceae bacterium]|jgi:RNA polymerase sigma factor (sigma-70 family)|nr:sigma-70 family RNA polymerase sigma factor [Bryobacteraceae bacterium]